MQQGLRGLANLLRAKTYTRPYGSVTESGPGKVLLLDPPCWREGGGLAFLGPTDLSRSTTLRVIDELRYHQRKTNEITIERMERKNAGTKETMRRIARRAKHIVENYVREHTIACPHDAKACEYPTCQCYERSLAPRH
jgi:hypothetical protein